MTYIVSLTANVLVAILLVATIASSMKLSARIHKLKADEAALRTTIGDLITASATAERAIAGLRSTLDECDRTLAERIAAAERHSVGLSAHVEAAERYSANLSAHVAAGESVISRIAAIVGQTRPTAAQAPVPPAPSGTAILRTVPSDAPAGAGNGERVGAALAAAQALSERALDRLRARAA